MHTTRQWYVTAAPARLAAVLSDQGFHQGSAGKLSIGPLDFDTGRNWQSVSYLALDTLRRGWKPQDKF